MLRGLLGVGGAVLAIAAWPVAEAAWQAQRADAVVFEMRTGKTTDLAQVLSGIGALDRAVATDPVAGRRLARSELLAGAALTPGLPASPEQRQAWLKQALGDLEFGLGNAPARGVGWSRLASVRQALDGPSSAAVAALMMSLDTAPMMSSLWPSRLRLFLDNWQYLAPQERDRVADNVATSWRVSSDRRWLAEAIRSPIDELFVRYFVRDIPGAQEQLTQMLAALRPK
ncbi:MAG: hypothetical protein ACOY4R_25970 [Pseudomonadota bacterium]